MKELHDFFKIKSLCWDYENEYRLCWMKKENDNKNLKSYAEIGLKIKAIYLGKRCEAEELLKKITNNREIILNKITHKENSFLLII